MIGLAFRLIAGVVDEATTLDAELCLGAEVEDVTRQQLAIVAPEREHNSGAPLCAPVGAFQKRSPRRSPGRAS